MKYRKRPVVIDAVQHDGQTIDVCLFMEETNGDAYVIDPETGALYIRTLEGDMRVEIGDYVIRGVQGEYYPCKPDIFAATYEPVEDER